MSIFHHHKVAEPVRTPEQIARIKEARKAAMAPDRWAANRFTTTGR